MYGGLDVTWLGSASARSLQQSGSVSVKVVDKGSAVVYTICDSALCLIRILSSYCLAEELDVVSFEDDLSVTSTTRTLTPHPPPWC